MCFDYNYNPIARRILFIKHSESIDRNEFLNLKGQLKKQNQLNDKEKIYYDYTVNPMILSEHAIFHLHKWQKKIWLQKKEFCLS